MNTIDACDLVPGDIIIVRLGDIVPADIKILSEGDGETPLQARLRICGRARACLRGVCVGWGFGVARRGDQPERAIPAPLRNLHPTTPSPNTPNPPNPHPPCRRWTRPR